MSIRFEGIFLFFASEFACGHKALLGGDFSNFEWILIVVTQISPIQKFEINTIGAASTGTQTSAEKGQRGISTIAFLS